MIGAIIGTSKIAQIHAREFANFKFKKIYLVSRYKKKGIEISKTLSKKLNKKIIWIEKKSITQKKNINILSICSPTNIHLKHIMKFYPKVNCLLVEKPVFWKKNLDEKKFLQLNQKIHNLRKCSVIVNYPMKLLAISFLKKFKFREKIKTFEISYSTRGRNIKNDIAIDLLPHGLAFLLMVANLTKTKLHEPLYLNHNTKNKKWNCSVLIGGIKCKFNFSENPQFKKTKLFFKINNKKLIRPQKFVNDHPRVFLKYKNQVKQISNPQSQSIQAILKNHKKNNFLKKEKNFSIQLMKYMIKIMGFVN